MAFKGKSRKFKREKPEFDQQIVDLSRVTRVTAGGKQLSFRALLIIGDRKGRVGYGLEKGKDVQIAVNKAYNHAKKNMITIPIVYDTLPHKITAKFKAAKVMVKPAPAGSGIIAGSVIRTVLELGGVPNASARVIGRSNNKITNVKALFIALQSFKKEAINRKPKTKTTSNSQILENKEEIISEKEVQPVVIVEKKVAKKKVVKKVETKK
ncbi:MAG: 30S ribosomal protein S5 [Candidatus Magasanikbacteria bacterium CG_4_9_14_3_um_filter_32_9]|uniref:Small ribosomal subunit protein uS5 n=1 Tax=Candidatus Magasanikbacteria bacterium CG_4_9_14_3_um_filter_32_9 TaxID=1974644 RepID=A0A2M7Z7S2_9BACT|nr:MAG: 30S ribosomal protein S5 [Candidatus Magasanikbacteria bacterium CG_4_9_14_3_um_filter_32_9]